MNIQNEVPETELIEFMPEFLEDRTEELKTIKKLKNESKFDDVFRITHKWKGYSKPYGFHSLEKYALQLEECKTLLKPQLDSLDQILIDIENYLELKREQIHAQKFTTDS